MNDDTTTAAAGPPDDRPPRRPPKQTPRVLSPEEHQRILELAPHASSREIASRLGLGRKIVRRVLAEAATPPPTPTSARPTTSDVGLTSKLDPFREAIAARVKKGLTTTRILREITELGYTGGRSILGAYARTLRTDTRKIRAKRRFETPVAEECQIDWSPYSVPIGGKITRVVAFAAILCWSRKLHVRFYRDERQATLITALDAAFRDFGGVARRVVVDGMNTASLARVGADGRPIWHPRFAAYTELCGCTPFLCKPNDPDRKGKDERTFWHLELDFVRGSEWASLEHMNEEKPVLGKVQRAAAPGSIAREAPTRFGGRWRSARSAPVVRHADPFARAGLARNRAGGAPGA